MRVRKARAAGVAVAAAAAVGALLVTSGTSSAESVELSYTATGQTGLTGLGATLPLGPGQADVRGDLQGGALSGTISLPETRTDFKLAGLLDTHAKVKVTQVGGLTGTLAAGTVDVTGKFDIQITEVGHFNIGIPLPNCKTTAPVEIKLKSSGNFNPAVGGTLAGSYRLPRFADCFVDTEIINFLVVDKDNPITIDLKVKQ
ncbi:hypothetical protein [Actinokineospora spheciospongiae]|uniref:hypothetical protein n=1 Tax=Actinokineospora spheciospongiae TaxID=909613 RepID=UPI000D962389|nr:hypothetical protein [Actinokineospora spheciospongiae]PWW59509.1 hypothetical protein DFQ13_108146 [Actinokineospora spheciospongiae]